MKINRTRLAASLLILASLSGISACVPLVAGGIGAGALIISDRRSSGAYLDDEAIGWKVEQSIVEKYGTNTHVNAISYNRSVLITGEAPDEAIRADVGKLAGEVVNVKGVVNEVVIAPPSSAGSRTNDTYITSKVKARFLQAKTFSPTHVKVHVAAATVYLLGIVTRAEADEAAQIASTTDGVAKVVRVFEYIDEGSAKQLDTRPPEDAREKK